MRLHMAASTRAFLAMSDTAKSAFAGSGGSVDAKRVAIVGGGIAGCCAASVLSSASLPPSERNLVAPSTTNDVELPSGFVRVDLFDQGRNGPGGRASHRASTTEKGNSVELMRWDHGCQFFRADTEQFQMVVRQWLDRGVAAEWKGTFVTADAEADADLDGEFHNVGSRQEFFGLPSQPPFYVGTNGIQDIPLQILAQYERKDVDETNKTLRIFRGTRVTRIERDPTTRKWTLSGAGGEAAYHDTPGKGRGVKAEGTSDDGERLIGSLDGYDAVIFTDVSSSSFGSWHRASVGGIPEEFSAEVRGRVGARVPLFASMVAYDPPLQGASFDAASFVRNDVLWFAARMKSKPGIASGGRSRRDCWTLVSTPKYAMQKIKETPMQDPKTGDFIPQSKEYLRTVPGPELETAFREALKKVNPTLSTIPPKAAYISAQRWGSAMPACKRLDETLPTQEILSGVTYDSEPVPLAPTKRWKSSNDTTSFIVDEELMLLQAGDMMSHYTAGFESASISGIDAAEYLLAVMLSSSPDNCKD